MSLLTLQEYKLFKGINNPNQDIKLQPLVDSVNSIIQQYCQLDLEVTTVTGIRVSRHYNTIILPKTNIISLDYLAIKRSSEVTEVLDPDQYILDKESGTLEIIDPLINLPSNPYSFIVDYTFGMDNVPFALKQAAVELMTYYDKREFNKSKDIGNGQSVDFTDSGILPSHIRTILDMYRVL
jgi:hypothetical protein